MSFDWINEEAFEVLQPDAVQSWLVARGWHDEGEEGASARGFAKARTEVLVPTKPNAPDYRMLIGILVERVCRAERMTPEALINELSSAGFDAVRTRALDTEGWTISLDQAASMFQQSKSTIQAAARAEASKRPRRSYQGRQAESVTKLLEHVRVGQTERGSYVLPLLIPYAFHSNDEPQMFDWFGRRVAQKLVAGLRGVDRALGQAGAGDPAKPFTAEISHGVSADLCLSLGKLLSEVGSVEISVRWASAHPQGQEDGKFQFSSSSSAMLYRVAEIMREQDPPPLEPIEGLVTKLDDTSSRVTVSAVVGNRLQKISFDLDEEYRFAASDAFRDRKRVLIEGPQKRHGNANILEELLRFEVIEDEEETEPFA